MIQKSTDVYANIDVTKKADIGGIKAYFYTEDKGASQIRIYIMNNGRAIDLQDEELSPSLNLFMQDGSIFMNEKVEIDSKEKGLIIYQINDEVIKHVGNVNAKLFLKSEEKSIHVANFSFNILNSGIEESVQKEIKVTLIEDTVRKIIEEDIGNFVDEELVTEIKNRVGEDVKKYTMDNPQLFKGDKGKNFTYDMFTPEQLASLKGERGEVNKLVNRNITSNGELKPLITFVDDDGRTEVIEKWEPILKEKRSKLTIPLITQWMDDSNNNSVITWSDVHRLKNTYGVEFVSHTHTHQHANTLSTDQIETEFKESKKILEREGLTHNIIVQPYGENTTDVRKISRKYFRANIGTREGSNTSPFDAFNAYRITLGESTYTTFDQYKTKIDEAISNNGWIIFKSHSQYSSFDDNQISIIKQIIDYARQNNMLEVNLEEGLDIFGNLIDVGDFSARAQGTDYYIMDKFGKIYSNKYGISYRSVTNNGSDINTPISNFDLGLTQEQVYSTRVTGFPENKAGTLSTYRASTDYYSYQLYYPYDSNNTYKRIFNRVEGDWGVFEKQNSDYLTTSIKNSLNSTPISEFNQGTTKEIVQSINAKGFPENKAGILETNKLNPLSYCYQLYYIYNSNHIYKRFYDSVNNWTFWERIDNTKLNTNLRATVNVEVPANSSIEITTSVSGITNNDNVVVTPVAGLEQGLMFNGFINTTDSVRIRLYNFTSSPILINRPFKIDIIKNN